MTLGGVLCIGNYRLSPRALSTPGRTSHASRQPVLMVNGSAPCLIQRQKGCAPPGRRTLDPQNPTSKVLVDMLGVGRWSCILTHLASCARGDGKQGRPAADQLRGRFSGNASNVYLHGMDLKKLYFRAKH